MKKTKACKYSQPRPRDHRGRSLRDAFKMLDLSEVENIPAINNEPAYQDFCTECSERVTICQCKY